ncbi:MAG: amidohydrolase family protein [Aureliella sp.]|jgi:predicted TIM-barrel fold metal-dependent hydrolase
MSPIASSSPTDLVDVNVYTSRWPFRRLPLDRPERLAGALRQRGVTQAWVGSFDALLHRDLAAVNAATVDDCQRYGEGVWQPVGALNPSLPDWREDLRRCHEDYHMSAVRLHPNYHRYKLEDPPCIELLRETSKRGLLVQIAISMEDVRTQHPLCQVPRVDPAPLKKLMSDLPELRVMLLNQFHGARAESAAALAVPGRTWFDFATLEGIEGVAKLVAAVGVDQVVYGSFAPLFYPESAQLKLAESGLPESTQAQIRSQFKLNRHLAP